MGQDETWHRGRPRTRPYCVRWGPRSPSPKGHSPQFSAHVRCGQTAGCINVSLSTEVGRRRADIVLDGNPAPFTKRGQSPQFSVHVYCGQTAAWIKMPLGMELGLGPGHIVLGGDPGPLPEKGRTAPNFRPMFVVAKRLDGSGCHLVQR